jgi:hypothetical protein
MRKLLTFLIALASIVFAAGSPVSAQVHVDPFYVLYHSPYLVGNWQIGGADTLGAGVSSSTVGSNSIRCYPGFFYERSTIGALGARINTVSAGGNLQVAIYASNFTTHRPTGLPIASSASLSTTTAGAVSTTLNTSGGSIALSTNGPQLLWWCSNFDNNTATANGSSGTPAMSALMGGTSTQANLQNTSAILSGVSTPQTFGTWPDLTSATFTDQLTVVWVNVQFQISSIP